MFSALSFFVWGKKNEIYNELRKAMRLGFLYFFPLVFYVCVSNDFSETRDKQTFFFD